MKYAIAILTLIICSGSLLASPAATPINASSTIKNVTIYRAYADIHRSTTVKVPAGSSSIVLEDLSNAIDYRSLQVTIPSDVILLSAAQQHNHLVVKKKTDKIVLVEDTIEQISMQLQLLQNRIQTLTEEEQLILANRVVSGTNTGLSSDELQKLAAFYRVRLLEI